MIRCQSKRSESLKSQSQFSDYGQCPCKAILLKILSAYLRGDSNDEESLRFSPVSILFLDFL